MTELIALLSTGKGSWTEVMRLIKSQTWEKVFLVTDQFGTKFSSDEKCEFVIVDFRKELKWLTEDIRKKLSEKVNGLEVAVNLSSGSGKEHMALLSAIMKLGMGFRLISFGKNGPEEL